jgi:hypothetical protein
MEDYLLVYLVITVISFAILYFIIQSAVLGALKKFNKTGGNSFLERLDKELEAKRNEDK